MKLLKNNKGIALVTSLMLTMISLTVVMALLYLVTQGINRSGQLRKYRTALDASYGGSEIVVKEIFPLVFRNSSDPSLNAIVESSFGGVSLHVETTKVCLQSKLTQSTSAWPAGCDKTSNPKNAPDMTFLLPSSTGNPFKVYSKIVSTVAGNTDTSGLQLEGSGVAESSSILAPQHFPYIYRMEIQGERQDNSTAKANIEVLYAY